MTTLTNGVTFCKECGKRIPCKRGTKKFCSACKQRLYRQRKKAQENSLEDNLTFDLLADLNRVRNISQKAGRELEAVFSLGGPQVLLHSINALWQCLGELGYTYNVKTKQWECVK